ncbi:SWIM zinc finger family protein [Oceanivirga salmonicida]|uniref:SWIM zinc finger family protein n=1 Tax=Oceanivirga salmonicida TaxID=1769291 RepID=UPI0009E93AA6|nr:SWIM zinc finger family protein [Oceanivirga salmonicida]
MLKEKREPVIVEGRLLAKTWWGKSWNKNLESYADYTNRIGRGRSYLRNGAVIHFEMNKGKIYALLQGSRRKPYTVFIDIEIVSEAKIKNLKKFFNDIDTIDNLIKGEFPEKMSKSLLDKKCGLFPTPSEIDFACSCPDWAYMCKHVAATLYAVGTKLDTNPMLFFELRGIDGNELIKNEVVDKLENILSKDKIRSHRVLEEDEVVELFNL